MIWEINQFETDPALAREFEGAFAEARPLLLDVPGCCEARLLRSVERPGVYLVQVGWTKLADHTEGYPANPLSAQVRALIGPYVRRIEPGHFTEA